MRSRVADHRARGYMGHSVKVGALDSEGGPALDAERIAASLADRQPGEYFIVDANGGLIPETALRVLRMLPAGLDFVLEAPCATWRETLSLRQRCNVPIIIDELAQQDNDITQIVARAKLAFAMPAPVYRQSSGDQSWPILREGSAHQVSLVLRRVCDEVSAALRMSFV